MANHWLRLWHDMPNDPKWRTIAKVSGQPIPSVIAVYIHLLVIASNATERGRTHAACSEDLASALDLELDQVEAILTAMQGRVLDGDLVTGWEKRQVEREDGSAERAKAWREAQKLKNQTQPNATERNRTPDKDKDTDKNKTKADAPGFALPPWVPADAWQEFEEHRKKLRKPMTDRARQLIVAELEKLKPAEPAELLAQSIRNGWQDVFPLKDKTSKGNSGSGPPWWASNEGIDAKARELGIVAPKGGSYADLKQLISVRLG